MIAKREKYTKQKIGQFYTPTEFIKILFSCTVAKIFRANEKIFFILTKVHQNIIEKYLLILLLLLKYRKYSVNS